MSAFLYSTVPVQHVSLRRGGAGAEAIAGCALQAQQHTTCCILHFQLLLGLMTVDSAVLATRLTHWLSPVEESLGKPLSFSELTLIVHSSLVSILPFSSAHFLFRALSFLTVLCYSCLSIRLW